MTTLSPDLERRIVARTWEYVRTYCPPIRASSSDESAPTSFTYLASYFTQLGTYCADAATSPTPEALSAIRNHMSADEEPHELTGALEGLKRELKLQSEMAEIADFVRDLNNRSMFVSRSEAIQSLVQEVRGLIIRCSAGFERPPRDTVSTELYRDVAAMMTEEFGDLN